MESFIYDTNNENIKLLHINKNINGEYNKYHLFFNIEYTLFHKIDIINMILNLIDYLKTLENKEIWLSISHFNNNYYNILNKVLINKDFVFKYDDFVNLINNNLFNNEFNNLNKILSFDDLNVKKINIFLGSCNSSNINCINDYNNYLIKNKDNISFFNYYIGYDINHNDNILYNYVKNNNFVYYNTSSNVVNLFNCIDNIIKKNIVDEIIRINVECKNCSIYDENTNSYVEKKHFKNIKMFNNILYILLQETNTTTNTTTNTNYDISINYSYNNELIINIPIYKNDITLKLNEIDETVLELKQNLKDFYKSLGRRRINEMDSSIKKLNTQKNTIIETNQIYYLSDLFLIKLHVQKIMYQLLQYLYNENIFEELDVTEINIEIFNLYKKLESIDKKYNKFNACKFINLLKNSLLISYKSTISLDCKLLLNSYFVCLKNEDSFINDYKNINENLITIVSIVDEDQVNNYLNNKQLLDNYNFYF